MLLFLRPFSRQRVGVRVVWEVEHLRRFGPQHCGRSALATAFSKCHIPLEVVWDIDGVETEGLAGGLWFCLVEVLVCRRQWPTVVCKGRWWAVWLWVQILPVLRC